MKNFGDFAAPFYDLAEGVNRAAYSGMIRIVQDLTPSGSRVLECAAAEMRRVSRGWVIMPVCLPEGFVI